MSGFAHEARASILEENNRVECPSSARRPSECGAQLIHHASIFRKVYEANVLSTENFPLLPNTAMASIATDRPIIEANRR